MILMSAIVTKNCVAFEGWSRKFYKTDMRGNCQGAIICVRLVTRELSKAEPGSDIKAAKIL